MWYKNINKVPIYAQNQNYAISKSLSNSSGIVYFQCCYAKWIVDSVYTITTWAGKQKYPPSQILLSDLWEN